VGTVKRSRAQTGDKPPDSLFPFPTRVARVPENGASPGDEGQDVNPNPWRWRSKS